MSYSPYHTRKKRTCQWLPFKMLGNSIFINQKLWRQLQFLWKCRFYWENIVQRHIDFCRLLLNIDINRILNVPSWIICYFTGALENWSTLHRHLSHRCYTKWLHTKSSHNVEPWFKSFVSKTHWNENHQLKYCEMCHRKMYALNFR